MGLGQGIFLSVHSQCLPFTDASILQPLDRADSHVNEERRLRLGPDWFRTLCLGGIHIEMFLLSPQAGSLRCRGREG